MNLFVVLTIIVVWCSFLNNPTQAPSVSEKQSLLQKQAVADTQRIFASELDTELPRLPFADWFGKVVGSNAGVIWQLTECGEQPDTSSNSSRDLRACSEVNALLPDNRKVIIKITVGTFKKGMIGTPAFYCGVIVQQEELFLIQRLRDLPELLRAPGSLANKLGVRLPAADVPSVIVLNDAYMARLPAWNGLGLGQPVAIEAPPTPPPAQAEPQPPTGTQKVPDEPGLTAANETPKLSGAVSWGDAITKVQPQYPANAKRVNASGRVDVKITISAAGRVIEAKAISGHILLRDAAVEAARLWVFKPAILNGVPVETQIVLTFVFNAPQ